MTNVSYGGLADWFIYSSAVDSKGLDSLIREVSNKTCVLDYCKSYKFEGDPDLAGIDVYATYLLQAVVTTCFVFAYLYKTWSAWRKRTGEAKGIGILGDLTTPTSINSTMSITPFSESLQDSLSVFWISSLYFSVAVTIAAIVYDYRDKAPGTQYGHLFSNTGAHFTLMVLICLWPWYSRRQARSYSRVVVLAVVVLFPLLFFATYFTQFWPILSGFEQACPFVAPELFRLYYVKCYFDIFVMTFVPAYRCAFPFSVRSGPEKPRNTVFGYLKRHRTRIASAALFVFYLLSFAILWIDLVIFGLSRQRAHELAGHSDSENVWSFGQVVSVTGWLPVIIGLFRVWFWESVHACYTRTIVPMLLAVRERATSVFRPSSQDKEAKLDMATSRGGQQTPGIRCGWENSGSHTEKGDEEAKTLAVEARWPVLDHLYLILITDYVVGGSNAVVTGGSAETPSRWTQGADQVAHVVLKDRVFRPIRVVVEDFERMSLRMSWWKS